jgi:hypothetical protein
MCTVSSELKLCSCKINDWDKVKHYWTLHRFIAGRNVELVGEVVLSYSHKTIDHELNERNILQALNSGNRFDFEPDLKNKDLLHMAFKFDENDWQHCNYGFEFKNGKWRKAGYDALMWMRHHEETEIGKIKDALL